MTQTQEYVTRLERIKHNVCKAAMDWVENKSHDNTIRLEEATAVYARFFHGDLTVLDEVK